MSQVTLTKPCTYIIFGHGISRINFNDKKIDKMLSSTQRAHGRDKAMQEVPSQRGTLSVATILMGSGAISAFT